jgi:hypothetical protein
MGDKSNNETYYEQDAFGLYGNQGDENDEGSFIIDSSGNEEDENEDEEELDDGITYLARDDDEDSDIIEFAKAPSENIM